MFFLSAVAGLGDGCSVSGLGDGVSIISGMLYSFVCEMLLF